MELKDFFEKYKINATEEELRKSYGYLNHMDDYLPKSPKEAIERSKYLRGLEFMFSKVLNNQIEPNGKTPNLDINSLNYREFLIDYENTVNTEYSKKNDGAVRKPYEGDELKAVNVMLENIKKYNKPPITCLKDQINAGADLDIFREKTTYNDRMSAEELQERRHAIATMYRVMTTIKKERTWKDRINPLNWWRIITENIYTLGLKIDLKAFIKKEPNHAYRETRNGHSKITNFNIYQASNEFSSYVNQNVISDREVSAFSEYYNEKASALESEKIDPSKRTGIHIKEAANIESNKNIGVKERYEYIDSKKLNTSIESDL